MHALTKLIKTMPHVGTLGVEALGTLGVETLGTLGGEALGTLDVEALRKDGS